MPVVIYSLMDRHSTLRHDRQDCVCEHRVVYTSAEEVIRVIDCFYFLLDRGVCVIGLIRFVACREDVIACFQADWQNELLFLLVEMNSYFIDPLALYFVLHRLISWYGDCNVLSTYDLQTLRGLLI